MKTKEVNNLAEKLNNQSKDAILGLIDMKVEEDMKEILSKIDSKFDTIEHKFDAKFDAMDLKLESMRHELIVSNIKVVCTIAAVVVAIFKFIPSQIG